jgi:hypothetical protein
MVCGSTENRDDAGMTMAKLLLPAFGEPPV